MNLSISNIAWEQKYDLEMYRYLSQKRIDGLEIAPSRVFGEQPYTQRSQGKEYAKMLIEQYGLRISSMQSIWFGRTERLFESQPQRELLLEYTKRAIEFANILQCKNLVFGSPKNRNTYSEKDYDTAVLFFRILGEYALQNDTVLSIEANPQIYGTNFINTTKEAFQLVKAVGSKGISVNLDLGTMLQNKENTSELKEIFPCINHIHLSEPHLKPVQFGKLQRNVIAMVGKHMEYTGFISIEMANSNNITLVKTAIEKLLSISFSTVD